ncbi:hypothetical protein AB7M50_001967 [Bradyrhizobium elkanii]
MRLNPSRLRPKPAAIAPIGPTLSVSAMPSLSVRPAGVGRRARQDVVGDLADLPRRDLVDVAPTLPEADDPHRRADAARWNVGVEADRFLVRHRHRRMQHSGRNERGMTGRHGDGRAADAKGTRTRQHQHDLALVMEVRLEAKRAGAAPRCQLDDVFPVGLLISPGIGHGEASDH